jgi:hypothetical protein|tara:strand:- start:665 stop:892 length:228 start_codon:yes stop_codon:yes gene_type:complete
MKIPEKVFNIDSLAHRKVRYILDKPSQLQDAVLDIIADGRDMWTVKEWLAVTSKIEASDLTVGEYLNQFNKRKTK